MKCYVLAILVLLTPVLASAQDRAPADGDSVRTVAVLDLVGKNVPRGQLRHMTTRLRAELAKVARYEVMAHARLLQVLGEQGIPPNECTDAGCAARLGRAAEVDLIVAGKVTKSRRQYEVNEFAIEAATGRVVLSSTVDQECTDARMLRHLVTRAVAELAGSEAPSLPPVWRDAGTHGGSDAQDGLVACLDLHVIHLKNGSEVEATNVKTDGSYYRATVQMRGGIWIERVWAADDVERVVRFDHGAGASPRRIAGEILTGWLGGMLGLAVGAVGLELGAGAGLAMGSACGVYLVGDTDRETGSFGATCAASFVGAAVGIALSMGPYTGDVAGFLSLMLAAPVSATIAFNMTRRSKCVGAQGGAALFDVDHENGRFAFGAPRMFRCVSPIDGAVMQTVDVLQVRF